MTAAARLVKRLAVLALPGVLLAGSLGGVLASRACHHMVKYHAIQHGAPADGPCWCDEMTGGGLTLQLVGDALPAVVTTPEPAAHQAVTPAHRVVLVPESPRFSPTPPPPNGRPS